MVDKSGHDEHCAGEGEDFEGAEEEPVGWGGVLFVVVPAGG